MLDIKYANAFSEVLEILRYISKEDYEKIPKENIKVFEENQNKEYRFNYTPSKTLDEQNVLEGTKVIIGLLFRDYWATDIQREKIIAKQKYKRHKIEEEKTQNYQYEDLFKKDKTEIQQTVIKKNTENVSLVEYKESVFTKILNKIKSIFKKNNK